MKKVLDVDNIDAFKRLHRQNLQTAAFSIGALLQAEIKSRTPVDTGFLRRQNQYEVQLMAKELSIIFFNDASYAQYIELGTYRQDAQPFMGNAIDEAQDEVSAVVVRHLRKI